MTKFITKIIIVLYMFFVFAEHDVDSVLFADKTLAFGRSSSL
jgi:hypothetical protein